MTEIKGIDISKWQGETFNFELARAEGFKFAILKCGGADKGLYKDSLFETNYLKCKLEKIGVGAYFFGHAKTIKEAEKEALFCLNLLKGKSFDYPIYYDVEGYMLNNTHTGIINVIKAFCDILEQTGYLTGFYMSKSTFYNLDEKELTNYQKWIASWSKVKPLANYGMWQYGGETNFLQNNHVAGVICDQNICFRNYPALVKTGGLNGYSKLDTTCEDIAYQVIDGVWGNGAERKHLMELAMIDYKRVQKEVNQILKG